MGKYYITSGNLEVVIGGNHINTHKEAAIEACLTFFNEGTVADSFVRVSEKGFDKHENDAIFDTERLLLEAGFEFEGE